MAIELKPEPIARHFHEKLWPGASLMDRRDDDFIVDVKCAFDRGFEIEAGCFAIGKQSEFKIIIQNADIEDYFEFQVEDIVVESNLLDYQQIGAGLDFFYISFSYLGYNLYN